MDRKETVIEYLYKDGLLVRLVLTAFDPNTVYWRVQLENTGAENTKNIKGFRSCCVTIPFEQNCRVFRTQGTWQGEIITDFTISNKPLVQGQAQTFSAEGGRSSQKDMPYMDINRNKNGVLLAVGWTGQWDASIEYENNAVTIKAGIEGTNFFLYPGEKVELASSLLLFYEQGQEKAHNAFRKLIKNEFTCVGKGERPKELPVAVGHWGFLTSEKLCEYAALYKQENVGAEVFWVDAGWFGTPELDDINSWIGHAGNWEEDERTHPDRFATVAKAAAENDMGFLLWYEVERACSIHKVPQEHPDWFFKLKEDENSPLRTYLLNLGCEGGYQYMLELLSTDIKNLDMAWYRQDFNILPLAYWRANDESGRAGMNEIKYINGLYRLLAELLRRFPKLMIDNCASGGSRLDIEMMKYSVPLWRSDFQCNSYADADGCQSHMMGGAWWMPYSASGAGRTFDDIYKLRSSYSNGLIVTFELNDFFSGSMDEWKRQFALLSKTVQEFKRVRKYYEGDYYPLLPQSLDKTVWSAWQFELPEENKGIIQVFRREASLYNSAVLSLGGLSERAGRTYVIKDLDSGKETVLTADELEQNGFTVQINQKRDCRLFEYSIS